MNLAITGGAGFLGYHLCQHLAPLYNEIFVIDISPIDPDEYPPNIRYCNVDVRNRNQLTSVFKDADAVIHAATALPLWKREVVFAINVDGTRNVLEVAKICHIQRVLFVSSTAVYGIPKKSPVYENDPLVGVGNYGTSKIEAEQACRQYREEGLCLPIVRPKTFIGTGRLGIFHILYDWVESGKKIPIIGKGDNRFQLLEVEDLVESIRLLLEGDEKKVNDTFNVGAQEFKTVKEDVGAMCTFAATGARVFPMPARLVKPLLAIFEMMKLSPLYRWAYGTADTDSFIAIDKIKEAVGWQPRYSNEEALIRSYRWYLEHKDEIREPGLTHRTAFKQGVLSIAKKIM